MFKVLKVMGKFFCDIGTCLAPTDFLFITKATNKISADIIKTDITRIIDLKNLCRLFPHIKHPMVNLKRETYGRLYH